MGGKDIVAMDLRVVTALAVLFLLAIAALEGPQREVPPGYDERLEIKGASDDPTPVYGTRDIEALSVDGRTSEGGSSEEAVPMTYEQVFKVRAWLEWNDDIGDNDRFALTLEMDGEVLSSSEDTSGSITVEAGDPDGALTGEIVLVVEALECPGAVGPMPVDRDTGNSWTLTVTATVAGEEVGAE